MKILAVFLFIFTVVPCLAQEIRDQKEAERVMRESDLESKNSSLYFAEDKKCRAQMRARNFSAAEVPCRQAVAFAEKLPKNRSREKHGAYEALGIALLGQGKTEEAIVNFNKAIE